MTAVHPPRPTSVTPAIGEDHLVAWTAGYLANADTAYNDGYRAGQDDGEAAGYLQALRDIANGTIAEPVDVLRHLITVSRADTIATARGLARIRQWRDDMEERARDRCNTDGRAEYRGGPVAWGGEAA